MNSNTNDGEIVFMNVKQQSNKSIDITLNDNMTSSTFAIMREQKRINLENITKLISSEEKIILDSVYIYNL
jgi:hypothetical protein